jgi:hypothetical protein
VRQLLSDVERVLTVLFGHASCFVKQIENRLSCFVEVAAFLRRRKRDYGIFCLAHIHTPQSSELGSDLTDNNGNQMAAIAARKTARSPLGPEFGRSPNDWELIPPEILEPRRRQLSVAHRVLDIGRQRRRVVAPIGERVSTSCLGIWNVSWTTI